MKLQEVINHHTGSEADAEFVRLLHRITKFALEEREVKSLLVNKTLEQENGTDADSESIASPSRDN